MQWLGDPARSASTARLTAAQRLEAATLGVVRATLLWRDAPRVSEGAATRAPQRGVGVHPARAGLSMHEPSRKTQWWESHGAPRLVALGLGTWTRGPEGYGYDKPTAETLADETRASALSAQLQLTPAQILAGMAARVLADEPAPDQAGAREFVIPVSAVFSPDKGETSYVWIIDEGTKQVSRQQVVARRLTDAGIVVEKGLDGGEWIATAGVHFLNEGQKVKILDAQGS